MKHEVTEKTETTAAHKLSLYSTGASIICVDKETYDTVAVGDTIQVHIVVMPNVQ